MMKFRAWLRIALLVILVVWVGARVRNARAADRYLRERKAVREIVKASFDHPYTGYRYGPFPPSSPNMELPGDEHIRDAMRRRRWSGDSLWTASHQPIGGGTNSAAARVEPRALLNFYFRGVESAGFRKSMDFQSNTDSMEEAGKMWANKDRSMVLTAHVISDRHSGNVTIRTVLHESYR